MNRKYIYLIIIILFVIVIALVSFLLQKQEKGRFGVITPTPTRTMRKVGEYEDSESYIKEFNETRDKVGYEYTLSTGEKITVRFPADVDPPPVELIEKMWKMRKE